MAFDYMCPICGHSIQVDEDGPMSEVTEHFERHMADVAAGKLPPAVTLSAEEIHAAVAEDLEMLVWRHVLSHDPLSAHEQIFFDVAHLNYEVGNGGFVQYFHNTRGSDIEQALAGLRAMRADEHVAVFDEAVATWEAERAVPGSCWAVELDHRAYAESALTLLDHRFSVTGLCEIEADFVRAHIDSFVH